MASHSGCRLGICPSLLVPFKFSFAGGETLLATPIPFLSLGSLLSGQVSSAVYRMTLYQYSSSLQRIFTVCDRENHSFEVAAEFLASLHIPHLVLLDSNNDIIEQCSLKSQDH